MTMHLRVWRLRGSLSRPHAFSVSLILGAAVFFILLAALGGCAQIVWERPGTPAEVVNMEHARCRLAAEGVNPLSMYAASDTPWWMYDSASSAAGGAIGDAIVNGISRGLDIAHTEQLCMQANGYTARMP